MKIDFKIMNNYKQQTIPSITFIVNEKNYIFNIPEGFQRFLSEYNEKFKKNSFIFFTNDNPENFIGSIGALCTITENKVSDDTCFFLNDNIYNYIFSLKYILATRLLHFSFYNIEKKLIWKGIYSKIISEKILQNFNVNDFIYNINKIYNNLNKTETFSADKFIKNKSNYIDIKIIENERIQLIKDNYLEIFELKLSNNNNCYFIITNVLEGGINKDLIKKFNITGKEVGEIKKKGFILKDNLKINIEDIKLPNKKSKVYIILEAYTNNDINIFEKSMIYNNILNNNNLELCKIFHLSNKIEYQYYKDFINRNNKFNNLICNEKYNNLDIVRENLELRCDKYLKLLNFKFSKFFPLFKSKNEIVDIKFNIGYSKMYYNENPNLKKEKIILINENYNDIFKNINSINEPYKIIYPFFNLLGTGSMIPSTYRNVTSILIGINKNCNILFDCGEGSIIQIYRQFGYLTENIIKNIRIVFLSHIHFDHNLGIFNLIRHREEILKKNNSLNELFIVCPYNCIKMLNNFEKYIYKSNIKIITTLDLLKYSEKQIQQFIENNSKPISNYLNYFDEDYKKIINEYQIIKKDNFKLFNEFMKNNQISDIIPVNNWHCSESVSYIIKFNNIKICFSGDTRPNKEFAKLGLNANILFHEATFEDDLMEEAIIKNHSTFKEAIDIGNKMSVDHIVLIHFSQRYNFSNKNKNLKNMINVNFKENNIIFGSDHLNFNLENITELKKNNKQINTGIFKDSN